jgi:hypothetical protein
VKIRLTLVAAAVAILTFFFIFPHPAKDASVEMKQQETAPQVSLQQEVRDYLESKQSPLAPETDFLVSQKHWRLLIAISAIESQYCKRQLGFNCWGVGDDSAYRHYSSIRAAITDANDLIEHWQKKGRWLTVEDMNCSFVVPCSPNWVRVVNKVLKDIEPYGRPPGTIHQ